jgi:hypothetical protein
MAGEPGDVIDAEFPGPTVVERLCGASKRLLMFQFELRDLAREGDPLWSDEALTAAKAVENTQPPLARLVGQIILAQAWSEREEAD